MVCQRWCDSEKAKTEITYNLDLIVTCGFFKKSFFLTVFLVEKIKLNAFSGV